MSTPMTLANMRPFIPLMEALLGHSIEEFQNVSPAVSAWIGKVVLVRDDMAGVFVGTLEHANIPAKFARLGSARKIFEWIGHSTLEDVAVHGVGQGSTLSDVVAGVIVCDIVEIILVTDSAAEKLLNYKVTRDSLRND